MKMNTILVVGGALMLGLVACGGKRRIDGSTTETKTTRSYDVCWSGNEIPRIDELGVR